MKYRIITNWGKEKSRQRLKRAIFLDRDGVIIEDTGYISSIDDIHLIPGIIQGLSNLQNDFRIIIITNQSGVARGYFTESDLIKIHERLIAILAAYDIYIDSIYFCPHHPTAGKGKYKQNCECRKPKPGMLIQASKDFGLNLRESVIIGDMESDIECGLSVGTKTVLLTNVRDIKRVTSKADKIINDPQKISLIIG